MKYIVGAYASAPSLSVDDKILELKFYNDLFNSIPEIKGLEIPFFGENVHRFGTEFLLNLISPLWDNVLTCIPGTMLALEKNHNFGLSSDNEEGRKKAVEMHKKANLLLHETNHRYGRKSFLAVQIATAPSMFISGVSSSLNSFMKSIEELLSWDWGGARLVIEHCDALIVGQPKRKGFFTLDKEIDAFKSLSTDNDVGVMINWARSAIEGRSPDKPIEHLKSLSENNLLSGLIFSGVSSNDHQYGAWEDYHMPFAQSYDVEFFEENSLLSLSNIKKTLNIVDVEKLNYLGIKLLSMPLDNSSIQRRVGINRDAISILNKIIGC